MSKKISKVQEELEIKQLAAMHNSMRAKEAHENADKLKEAFANDLRITQAAEPALAQPLKRNK